MADNSGNDHDSASSPQIAVSYPPIQRRVSAGLQATSTVTTVQQVCCVYLQQFIDYSDT